VVGGKGVMYSSCPFFCEREPRYGHEGMVKDVIWSLVD